MSKILLHIPVSELYDDMLQSQGNELLDKVQDIYGNVLESVTILRYMMPMNEWQMNEHYKVTCG